MALEFSETTAAEVSAPTTGRTAPRWLRQRITVRDRMVFTEQLALLLETGVSLYQALEALKKQTANAAMIDLIDRLNAEIAAGKSFSQALQQHPAAFSASYVNLIAASEQGGFMHEVLDQLRQMEEKREQLRNTLVSAFSYPAFLLVFSAAVVVFVLVFVFPKFGTMFASIHDQLPATTRFLMALSDLLRSYWIPGCIVAALSLVALNRWLATPSGTERLDRLKLGVPLVRDIFAQLYLVQMLRVMSLSLANGVTVMDTLNACKELIQNSVFRRFIGGIENRVHEGGGIAAGFAAASFVPAVARQMIATAEETGNLARVTGRVADFYELELEKRLATLSRMAEPLMLVVMGLVVGLLVSSLILPIFKLSRAVS